jgi:hypothetical protein
MAGILLIPLLLVGAVYAAQLAVAVRAAAGHRRRREILEAAAARLGAPPGERRAHLMGFAGAVPVTFSLSGFIARVEIDLPSTELLVAIRPRLLARRAGRFPGQHRFHAAMIVEGAPREVVGRLLTPELETQILALRPLEVLLTGTTLEITIDAGGGDDVRRTIELALGLAASVPAAIDAADREVPGVVGAPYRPHVDATAVRAAHAARAEEVETLQARWTDRAHAARRALMFAAILVLSLLVSLALGS